MKTLTYPIIRVKCDTPKCKQEGVFEGYDHAEVSGWSWTEKDGWRCGKCEMERVARPFAIQATLI